MKMKFYRIALITIFFFTVKSSNAEELDCESLREYALNLTSSNNVAYRQMGCYNVNGCLHTVISENNQAEYNWEQFSVNITSDDSINPISQAYFDSIGGNIYNISNYLANYASNLTPASQQNREALEYLWNVTCESCSVITNEIVTGTNCCADTIARLDTIISQQQNYHQELSEITSHLTDIESELEEINTDLLNAYLQYWTSSLVTNGISTIVQYLPNILTNKFTYQFFTPQVATALVNQKYTLYGSTIMYPNGTFIQTAQTQANRNFYSIIKTILDSYNSVAGLTNYEYYKQKRINDAPSNITSTTQYFEGWQNPLDFSTNIDSNISIQEISPNNDFYAATIGYLRNLDQLSKQQAKSLLKIYHNTKTVDIDSKQSEFETEFEEQDFQSKQSEIESEFTEQTAKSLTSDLFDDEQTLTQKFANRLPNIQSGNLPESFSFAIPSPETDSPSANLYIEGNISQHSWFFELIRAFFRLLWWSVALSVLIYIWGYLVTFIRWLWKLFVTVQVN